jgi:exopolysaccharide biosynthesis polyprenyl glycosylphosphotransferase
MSSFGFEDTEQFLHRFEETNPKPKAERRSAIRDRFERALTAVEVLLDWLMVAVAINLSSFAYRYLHLGKRVFYPFGTLAYVSFATGTLFVLLLDHDGAYRSGSSLLRIKETERALRVSMQTCLLILPITFYANYMFSRWIFLLAMLILPLLQTVEKQGLFVAVRALRSRGIGAQNVLIYGAGNSGRRVFSALVRSPKLGLNPVVLIDDDPELQGQEVYEYAYRHHRRSVKIASGPITKELIEQYQCDFLIIAIPTLDRERFALAVQASREAGSRLAFLPGHAFISAEMTDHADIDGILLSVVGRPPHSWHYELAKRPFDFVIALALIVLLAPLWSVIAILIRLDSKGPILFRQQRMGRNGSQFSLYKFRSMHSDAPAYDLSPRDSSDPRITRIGRFLRLTSLDELPQLLNVVKGEMSLVGPRPEMPFIARHYTALHRQRLEVKPGITGLWQLSADRAFLIHENMQYDLYYIKHRSFFMDFAILLHTLVFAMRGV